MKLSYTKCLRKLRAELTGAAGWDRKSGGGREHLRDSLPLAVSLWNLGIKRHESLETTQTF